MKQNNLTFKELRCINCSKLLAKCNTSGLLSAQIKCPRCGTMNNR